MKKIVAINASPRAAWNTGTLVRKAAGGAESEGAEIRVFDLYNLEPFTGCVSCFGCKLPKHRGVCVCRDGLTRAVSACIKPCPWNQFRPGTVFNPGPFSFWIPRMNRHGRLIPSFHYKLWTFGINTDIIKT